MTGFVENPRQFEILPREASENGRKDTVLLEWAREMFAGLLMV